jgi:hypothetical protein
MMAPKSMRWMKEMMIDKMTRMRGNQKTRGLLGNDKSRADLICDRVIARGKLRAALLMAMLIEDALIVWELIRRWGRS